MKNWKEHLKDIRDRIAGRYEPLKKDKIHKDSIHQIIVKKDRGKSFKGHNQQVWYHADKGQEKGMIMSQNQYYSGGVSQVYDIDKHETRTSFTAGGNTPQYLLAKLDDIGRIFNPSYVSTGDPFMSYNLEIDDNPIINIGYCWSVKYISRSDGVHFVDHYDSIQELKQLNNLYRRLRDKLKTEDAKAIAKHCYPIEGSTSPYLKLNKNYLL